MYALVQRESAGESGGAVWDIWRADDFQTICAFLRRVAIEDGRPPPVHGIHDHTVYIDAKLRKRLADEEGITGWRFVQKQGEAVFIPNSCPHQVLNLRSAIKVCAFTISKHHTLHRGGAWAKRRWRPCMSLDACPWMHVLGCMPLDACPWMHAPHLTSRARLDCAQVAMDFVSPEHVTRCLDLSEEFRTLPKGHDRKADPLGTKAIVLHAVSHALSTLDCAKARR